MIRMSNLSENIKKHFTDKIIDLIYIAALIGGVFFVLGLNTVNEYVRLALIAVVLIVIWLLQKKTNKWLENWEVPSLVRPEQKSFNLCDTAYGVIIGVIFMILFYVWSGKFVWLLFGFIVLMIVVREYKKWKNFNKEFGPVDVMLKNGD